MDESLYSVTEPIVYCEHNPNPSELFAYGDKDAFFSSDDEYNLVLENQVIYFGRDIQIKEDYKNALDRAIERAGGTVANIYNHQFVTIVILKYRSTRECLIASKDQKLIASLWWLTNTLFRGYQSSPLCTLLDYPIPPGGLPGMENLVSEKKVHLTDLILISYNYADDITGRLWKCEKVLFTTIDYCFRSKMCKNH
jgi:hypothetical protein